jgi:hypothetical protein
MDEIIYTTAAILAVTLPWFGLYAAYRLQKFSRSEEGKGVAALRERADVALVLALASILGGILSINRFFDMFEGEAIIKGGAIVFILASIVILVNIPGLIWTKRYLRDGFIDDDSTSTD